MRMAHGMTATRAALIGFSLLACACFDVSGQLGGNHPDASQAGGGAGGGSGGGVGGGGATGGGDAGSDAGSDAGKTDAGVDAGCGSLQFAIGAGIYVGVGPAAVYAGRLDSDNRPDFAAAMGEGQLA